MRKSQLRSNYTRITRKRRGSTDRDLAGLFVVLLVWAIVFIGAFVWEYETRMHTVQPTVDDIAISSVNLVPLGK